MGRKRASAVHKPGPQTPAEAQAEAKAAAEESAANPTNQEWPQLANQRTSSPKARDPNRNLQVKTATPKSIDGGGCHGGGVCKNPVDIGNAYLLELQQALTDVADYIVSPLMPGPFLQQTLIHGQHPDNAMRMDRLWELRLCVEILRDSLESFEAGMGKDALNTPEETLDTVEDTLCRMTELSFVHNLNSDRAEESTALLVSAVRSEEFRRGGLTQSLLSSRLGISGLIQAVLGELTEWQTRPSEAELRVWQNWDRIYEQLATNTRSKARDDGSALGCGCCLADARDLRWVTCGGDLFGGS